MESKRQLLDRFFRTAEKASEILELPLHELNRDDYIRICSDFDIEGRLNKTELNLLGGYSQLRQSFDDEESNELPKILLFDLETAPMIAYTWGIGETNLTIDQIIKDSSILSWSAKWYGSDEIMYADVRDKKEYSDDKQIVESLLKLLNEASVAVAHNLNSFDYKVLNSRIMFHKLHPPTSFERMDTLRMVKKNFKFPSSKLKYLSDRLCTKFVKSEHAKFPGFSMWTECMKGNKEAFKEMQDYNEMDVKSLEELFTLLLPWEDAALFSKFSDVKKLKCTCGSESFRKNGFVYSNSAKFQRYTCVKCGAQTRGVDNLRLNKIKTRPVKR